MAKCVPQYFQAKPLKGSSIIMDSWIKASIQKGDHKDRPYVGSQHLGI